MRPAGISGAGGVLVNSSGPSTSGAAPLETNSCPCCCLHTGWARAAPKGVKIALTGTGIQCPTHLRLQLPWVHQRACTPNNEISTQTQLLRCGFTVSDTDVWFFKCPPGAPNQAATQARSPKQTHTLKTHLQGCSCRRRWPCCSAGCSRSPGWCCCATRAA